MRTRVSTTVCLAILLAAVVLTGCSPNNLTIRLAYSRLDNSISKRFNEYATFSEQQQAWIESAASDYQLWHRETELPGYARLFDEVAVLLEDSKPVTEETVAGVFESLEAFSRRSFSNSPFAQSVPFLEGLTDQQIRQIEARFDEQDANQLQHIRDHASASHDQDRASRISRNIARIGLSLDDYQENIIRKGFDRYAGDREDRVSAWQVWQRKFIQLLETRDQPGFNQSMQDHINEYQQQMQIQYPERTAQNRATAIVTVTELVNSLDLRQRRDLVNALGKYSVIFIAMAQSTQTTLL